MDFQKIIDMGKAAQAAANLMNANNTPSITLGDGTVVTVSQPLREALRTYGKAVGLDPEFVDRTVDQGPFGFPSFAHAAERKAEPVEQVRAAPKPRTAEQVTPEFLRGSKVKAALPDYMKRGGGVQLKLVGSHYRPSVDQDALRQKGINSMVIVVREPDNAVDKNALAVYIWDRDDRRWAKVGYVQRAVNSGLTAALLEKGPGYVYEGHLLGVGQEYVNFELGNLLRYSSVPEQLFIK